MSVYSLSMANRTTPAESVAPFHCMLVRECEDRPGTDSWNCDPDGLSYANLGDAIDQAEALAGLNPDAGVIILDSRSLTVSH